MVSESAYSASQIERYLDYISFPPSLRTPSTPLDSTYLHSLFVHQITKIPYDNLSLHYSPTHKNSLDPQDLFDKFVGGENGRGGYCMETVVFFRHILKGLGFRVYSAGARIRLRKDRVPHGPYVGWVHCTNIVTLADGSKYSVDVGFGGDGQTVPLLLESGRVVRNLGSQEIRLIYDSLPDASEPDHKVWIYQYRNSPEQDWNSYYAFQEFEFYQADFIGMNYWTSSSPESFQIKSTIVVLFVREGEQVVGKYMLTDGIVKRNMGGKTEIVEICTDESQRVKALEKYFDIRLSQEQVEGIRGTITELKGTADSIQ